MRTEVPRGPFPNVVPTVGSGFGSLAGKGSFLIVLRSPAHPPRMSAAMATLLLRSQRLHRSLRHRTRPTVGEQL